MRNLNPNITAYGQLLFAVNDHLRIFWYYPLYFTYF